jgi:hypothetical protein
MNQYSQVLGEARPCDKKNLSFVGVFPEKLLTASIEGATPRSRRNADVCAASLLMALAANWRTGEVRQDRCTTLRHSLGMGVMRWHRTVETAQSVCLWRDRRHVDLEYWTHRRTEGEPRFVCVDRRNLFELIEEHHLSPQAVIVYTNLLVLKWSRRCPTTLTKIAQALHVAHRTLRAALDELSAIGLCRYHFRQGQPGELWLDEDIVLANVNTYTGKKKAANLARQTAVELWHAFGLNDTPPSLTTKVNKLLKAGAKPQEIIDRTLAMGTLANAANPIAVIGARLQAILREVRTTLKRQTTRKEKDNVVIAEPDPADDDIKRELAQVRAAIGESRLKEVTAKLRRAQRQTRTPLFLPGHLLVVHWARHQVQSRPDLDYRSALLCALRENNYETEVPVLD